MFRSRIRLAAVLAAVALVLAGCGGGRRALRRLLGDTR